MSENFFNPVNLNLLSKNELEQFFNQFEVICTDCDGVLWFDSATKLFPHSTDFINHMINSKKRIYFMTNNNMTTREKLLQKSLNYGFEITLESMTTPQYTIARYLKKINFSKRVYVIGFEQIGNELDEVGIEHFGIGPDVLEPSLVEYMKNYKLEENVGAVIVGIDAHFSLPKLIKAINYLKDPEVLFISTNSDDKLDLPDLIFPDTGSIVAAIETGSRRKSKVFGKVSSIVCDLIAETSSPINNEKTLMIGDRIDVDVVFGKNCGMKTLLVESGMDKLRDVKNVRKKLEEKFDEEELKKIPDFYASGLEELYKKLKIE